MYQQAYIGCPDCDLLHRRASLPPRSVAICSRCGAMLYRSSNGNLDYTLALAITGLVLFAIANVYPFLSLALEGQVRETVLITGVMELYHQDMQMVAILVLCTGIVFPLIVLSGLVYLLVPLKFNFRLFGSAHILRLVQNLRPWGMMEVFLLGILVSMVKLLAMAEISPGLGFYAFLVLVFVLTSITSIFHPEDVWERMSPHK